MMHLYTSNPLYWGGNHRVLILVVMDDALVLVGENGKFKRMAA